LIRLAEAGGACATASSRGCPTRSARAPDVAGAARSSGRDGEGARARSRSMPTPVGASHELARFVEHRKRTSPRGRGTTHRARASRWPCASHGIRAALWVRAAGCLCAAAWARTARGPRATAWARATRRRCAAARSRTASRARAGYVSEATGSSNALFTAVTRTRPARAIRGSDRGASAGCLGQAQREKQRRSQDVRLRGKRSSRALRSRHNRTEAKDMPRSARLRVPSFQPTCG